MAGKHKAAPRGSAYDEITARILAELEKGKVPWSRPWVGDGWPRNLDGKRYRGINVLLLAISDYTSPHWGTYKAINDHSGRVRRGERGTRIFVWRPETDEETRRRIEREAKRGAGNDEPRPLRPILDSDTHWIVSSHMLFNAAQCDGLQQLDVAPPPRTITPIAAADMLIAGMPDCPPIREAGERAFWRPATDTITTPPRKSFRSDASYYSTVFHELTHATASPKRVGRKVEDYSFNLHARTEEELIAEMGASFLRAEAGIDSPDDDSNSVAYIADWMGQIKADKTLVVRAAKAAQKAADYILGAHAVEMTPPGESLNQAA